MKKTYIIPTIEVIEFAAENMIAISGEGTGVGGGNVDGGVDGGGGLTNKRQPIGGTWNSENWNQVEE